MKKILLSKNKVALVDDEDYEYLNQWKWSYSGHGYAHRKGYKEGKYTTIYMHREILKPPEGKLTDHKNMNGLDNRRKNLRICDKSQNGANRPKQKDNTSGHKGIYWFRRDKNWLVQIRCKSKNYYLGYFNDKNDAIKVYNEKSKELFGEFAYKEV